ncbi:MAG: isoprenyl transferase [Coriobacteriia bacterium]|nr:isoprenyl transferase [Coriobacteriia bacterium]
MADRAALEAFFSAKRDRELLAELRLDRIPRHVAIIMDGNGRWAAKRGLPRVAGHRAGVKAIRETIRAALELGIEVLTVYSFSTENWRRPADEVSHLMDLFVEVLHQETSTLSELGVRVLVIGRRDGLPERTAAAFERAEKETANNDRLTYVVALNYGGRQEIVDAAKAIAAQVADRRLDPSEIDEHVVARHLYTTDLPDPDLLIRTSGEMRVSNFLLWQIAYSEMWVTSTLWPDFDRHDLLRAVLDYQRRSRRFGGL